MNEEESSSTATAVPGQHPNDVAQQQTHFHYYQLRYCYRYGNCTRRPLFGPSQSLTFSDVPKTKPLHLSRRERSEQRTRLASFRHLLHRA